MKKYVLTCFMVLAYLLTFAQPAPFVLKGTIKGKSSGMLKLSYGDMETGLKEDSAMVKQGRFEFRGMLQEPNMAYISDENASMRIEDPNVGSLFIQAGTMTLTLEYGNFKDLKLTGSATHDELAALDVKKQGAMRQLRVLSSAYDKANMRYIEAKKAGKPESELEKLKEEATQAKDRMDPYSEQINKLNMEFIRTHPDSYYAASMLQWQVSSLPLQESKAIYEKLSARIKQSETGKRVAKEIRAMEGGSPGAQANLFTATDINGNTLNLKDYSGKKYLLLDFWASWCVPCRKGNPHLLSLYSKYKDKGLEIVGVSDDDSNEKAWKAAVEKDGIGVWKHVLRGLKRKGNDFDRSNDLSDFYAIHSLPTKILIDKNGIIIGRYGGGGEDDAAMDKKLAELFEK